ADVLQARREVLRVEGLEGVEQDGGGEQPGEPDEGPPAGGSCHGGGCLRAVRCSVLGIPPRATRRRRPSLTDEVGGDAGGEDEIEGDEEVGGVAAGLERDAEGEGDDDREGERERPAVKAGGEGRDDRRAR